MTLSKKTKSTEPVFVERPVPSVRQVRTFEKAVEKELHDEEVDDELLEIYSEDEEDSKAIHLKPKGKSVLLLVLKNIFVAAIIFCFAYGLFFYLSNRPADATALELNILSPEKIKAGESFSYTIKYHNNSKYILKDLQLELKYPDGFIFESVNGDIVDRTESQSKNIFKLADLTAGQESNIEIKGKIIAKKDSAALLLASLSYKPADFSSEFKKDAVSSIMVDDLGFEVDFEYANAILVGEDNEIDVYFKNVKQNFLDDFEVSFMFPENILLTSGGQLAAVSSSTVNTNEELLQIEKNSSLLWKAKGLVPGDKTYKLPIYYQANKKIDDSQEIIIRLSKKTENGESYIFLEKNIKLNVMNSNLNLTLILNGSKNDNSANFGSTLNYSLTYANKSDSQINDVAIMAILKSDFLDFDTFKNEQKGIVSNQSVTWTKEQIPALASLAPGAEGVIDFSINLKPFTDNDLGKNATVSSYAQFNINNKPSSRSDSQSNNINTKLNSDLNLIEKILYFDDNNTPVGSGPLPPKVGELTSFRVYWTLKNNLHDLSDTKVSMVLPDNVNFSAKNSATLGLINFDPTSRTVVWEIGDLPVSTYRADAEFNISVKPSEDNRNRVMILSPGALVTATDKETKASLEKKGDPKTTKLEDDDIAGLNNSGLVE
jgi:hypothetical protein